MSRHATDWAWETDPGSSSLKLILLSMADRADEYNLCYPSIERLVKDTCLNKKTVQAGLISLMKMGLISDIGFLYHESYRLHRKLICAIRVSFLLRCMRMRLIS